MKSKIVPALVIFFSLFIFIIGDYIILLFGYSPDVNLAFRIVMDYFPLRGIVLFFFNFLGIISSDILFILKSYKVNDSINKRELLFKTFHSKSFYESILYAPIVFLIFYLIARDQPDIDYITTLLFAYYNGFFWKTLRS